MPGPRSSLRILRRRFLFWCSFVLFCLGERLRASELDDFAAALLRASDRGKLDPESGLPEHWVEAGNRTWRWFEREHLIDGRWKVTGITTPVNRLTGDVYAGRTGYLDESLVPEEMRTAAAGVAPVAEDTTDPTPGRPDASRRARHGRPPSKWLRSLNADELRIWLRTIDPSEAGVSGMTFFTHLTRDHSFDPAKITGLTEDEQAKLHAAAHDGY